MSKIYEALKQAEQDRSDAQRKALSTLLARFTADRDSLISSIQECQQQLATLAAKIDEAPGESPRLNALTQSVAQLEREQQRLAAMTPTADIGAAFERLAADRDHHAAALRRYGEQLADVLTRLDTVQTNAVPAVQALQEQLSEIRTQQALHEAHVEATAQTALQAATEARERIDRLATADSMVTRLASEQETLSGAVTALHDELSRLLGQVHSLDAAASRQSDEVRQQIDELVQVQQLAGQHRQSAIDAALSELRAGLQQIEATRQGIEASAATAPAAAVSELATMLQRAQADIHSLLQRVDEVDVSAGPQLELLREQVAQVQEAHEQLQRETEQRLAAVSQRSDETSNRIDDLTSDAVRGVELVDIVRQLAVEEQGARDALQGSQRRLEELVAQIDASQRDTAPQLEGLRSQLDALRGAVAQAERSSLAVADEALARAQEAVRRVEAFTGSDEAQRAQAAARLGQLSDAQETLAAAVAQYRDEVARSNAQLAAVRQEQVLSVERQLGAAREADRAAWSDVQQAASQALAQATEAVRRIESVASQQAAHQHSVEERVAQLAAARDSVQLTTEQLAEHVQALSAHLASPAVAGAMPAEVVQQAIANLQQSQRNADEHTQQALGQLRGELTAQAKRFQDLQQALSAYEQRVESVSSTVSASEARTQAALTAQSEELRELSGTIEGLRGSSAEAVNSVQHRLAGLETEQRGTAGRARAAIEALESSLAGMQRRLDEVASQQGNDRQSADSALTALRGQIETALHDWKTQFAQISDDVHAALSRHAPALADLQSAVGEIESLHSQSIGDVRAIAEAARGRAADALQRLDDLSRRQRGMEQGLEASQALQATLEPIVRRCEAELGALAAEAAVAGRDADARWTALRSTVDEVVARLSGGEAERAAAVERWDNALAALRAEVGDMRAATQARAEWHEDQVGERLDALATQLTAEQQSRTALSAQWEAELSRLQGALRDDQARLGQQQWSEWNEQLGALAAQLALIEQGRARDREQWAAEARAMHDALNARHGERQSDDNQYRLELETRLESLAARQAELEEVAGAQVGRWESTLLELQATLDSRLAESALVADQRADELRRQAQLLAEQVAEAEQRSLTAAQRLDEELARVDASVGHLATLTDDRLRSGEQRWDELRSALDDFTARLGGVEHVAAADPAAWQGELARLSAAVQQLVSERALARPDTDWQQLRESIESLAGRVADGEAQRSARADAWQTEGDALRRAVAELRERAESQEVLVASARMQELQASIAQLEARLADSEAERAAAQQAWQARLGELQDAVGELRHVSSWPHQVFEPRWQDLQTVLSRLAARVAQIESNADSRPDALRADIVGLQQAVAELRQSLTTRSDPHFESLGKDLRGGLDELRAQVAQQSSEQAAVLHDSSLRVDALRAVIDDLGRRSAAAVAAVSEERSNELQAVVATLSARLDALEREPAQAEQPWQEAVARLRDELAAHGSALQHVLSSGAQLATVTEEQHRVRELLDSALRAQATADDALRRTEVLDGAQAASLDVLRQQIARLTEEGASLRQALLAAPLPTGAASAEAVAPLQAELAELREQAAAASRAFEQRLDASIAQAELLARRIDQLVSEREQRDDELASVLTALASEREAVNAAIREQAGEIGRLVGHLEQRQPGEPAIAQLQAGATELSAALEQLRAAHAGSDQRATDALARLSRDGEALRDEVRSLRTGLQTVSQRVEHDAEAAQGQLAGLEAGLAKERSERLDAEAETRHGLRDVSERMAEAVQALERAVAARVVAPPEPPVASGDPVVAGLSRVEARLDRLLSSPAPVAPAAQPPGVLLQARPAGLRWPLVAMAVLGLITTLSAALLLMRDSPGRRDDRDALQPPVAASASRADDVSAAKFAQGLAALQAGDLEKAERLFRDAVALRPGSAEARNNLAVVLVEQRRFDAAAEQLREALRLQPDYERARANLNRIEQMKASSSKVEPPAGAAAAGDVAPAPTGGALEAAPPVAEPKSAPAGAAPAVSAPAAAAAAADEARCTVRVGEQRICCKATEGGAETCFALAATPTRERTRPKRKPAAQRVDDEDLDLLYDLP